MPLPKNLQHFTVADVTHRLDCTHVCGHRRKEYTMLCRYLGRTPSGKIKVLVFGRLYWKNTENVKAVRYVEEYRLRPMKPTEQNNK